MKLIKGGGNFGSSCMLSVLRTITAAVSNYRHSKTIKQDGKLRTMFIPLCCSTHTAASTTSTSQRARRRVVVSDAARNRPARSKYKQQPPPHQ